MDSFFYLQRKFWKRNFLNWIGEYSQNRWLSHWIVKDKGGGIIVMKKFLNNEMELLMNSWKCFTFYYFNCLSSSFFLISFNLFCSLFFIWPWFFSSIHFRSQPIAVESPGKSGAKFYQSYDRLFIIKTLTSEEVERMHSFLKQYHPVSTLCYI